MVFHSASIIIIFSSAVPLYVLTREKKLELRVGNSAGGRWWSNLAGSVRGRHRKYFTPVEVNENQTDQPSTF